MKKNILVTGSNGFIGSHLVDRLTKNENYRVTAIDIAPRSTNIEVPKGVTYIQGEVGEVVQIGNILSLQGIDTVFHLAWSTIPEISMNDPMAELNENLKTTISLLEACHHTRVRRFIFLSSGGTVYGVPSQQPVVESHPKNPISAYGIAKLTIEKYLHLYHHMYGLEYIIFRPSAPYGPRQNFFRRQGAISVFLFNALTGNPISIWGDGKVGRDFFFISDLIDALENGLVYSPEAHHIFNLGGKETITLNQIVEYVQSITNKKVNVDYLPYRAFDVPNIKLCCKKAKNELKWEPKISLQEGMQQTMKWIKAVL